MPEAYVLETCGPPGPRRRRTAASPGSRRWTCWSRCNANWSRARGLDPGRIEDVIIGCAGAAGLGMAVLGVAVLGVAVLVERVAS